MKLQLKTFKSYKHLIPDFTLYCKPVEIDALHKYTLAQLNLQYLYDDIEWCFAPKFRETLGQAEWGEKGQNKRYRLRYSSLYWIPLGICGRRNTIIHEVCHIAVEELYGHGSIIDGIKVTSHGKHFQDLMKLCGENYHCEYRLGNTIWEE